MDGEGLVLKLGAAEVLCEIMNEHQPSNLFLIMDHFLLWK